MNTVEENLSFDDHKEACAYMGEENPKFAAWTEGPYIGAFRVAYVNAHKEHAEALKTGNPDAIGAAWDKFCKAKNEWITCEIDNAE